MYTRRLKHKFERWGLACQQYEFWRSTKFPQDHGTKYLLASKTFSDECVPPLSSFSKYLSGSSTFRTLANGDSFCVGQETPTNCSSKCPLEISQLKWKPFSFFHRGSVLGLSTVAESPKNEEDSNSSGKHKGDDKDTRLKLLAGSSYIFPKMVQPYAHLARLDKPIGTWLLAWPCTWSITLAASLGNLPNFKILALFGCGALLLRSSGCTVNDLLDTDIDILVERTMSRPVPSGVLTQFQGLGFQLLLGLGIPLQLNNYSHILGASSLLLGFSYPLMKRFIFWPQAYLSLIFNWGALLWWAAIRGSLESSIVFPL